MGLLHGMHWYTKKKGLKLDKGGGRFSWKWSELVSLGWCLYYFIIMSFVSLDWCLYCIQLMSFVSIG